MPSSTLWNRKFWRKGTWLTSTKKKATAGIKKKRVSKIKNTSGILGKAITGNAGKQAQQGDQNYLENEKSYRMWFNYDNDQQVYCLPVLPEKLKITIKGETTSATIDQLGEIVHKGKRDAMAISFSSYFPAVYGSYCTCLGKDFKSPQQWHNWMVALQEADKPAHVVLANSPIGMNIYADITSYVPEEQGGDVGTIHYTVELKEHRVPTVRKYTKKKGKKAKVKSSNGRANNKKKSKTYTVKKGDCLWNIAKKYYGSGSKYTKIYNANKTVLDKAARKYGYSSCRNGNLIFPGTKITIP